MKRSVVQALDHDALLVAELGAANMGVAVDYTVSHHLQQLTLKKQHVLQYCGR